MQSLADRSEEPRLIDFGIARIGQPETRRHTTMHVAGTLPYMASEQLTGKPSETTDTYALAVIAYEMITGEAPFPASNPAELIATALGSQAHDQGAGGASTWSRCAATALSHGIPKNAPIPLHSTLPSSRHCWRHPAPRALSRRKKVGVCQGICSPCSHRCRGFLDLVW